MNFVSVIGGVVLLAMLFGVAPESPSAHAQTGRMKQFIGVYAMTRAMASDAEALTLTLNRDQSCTLKTSFPASKTKPAIEKGSWKIYGRNVVIDLTSNGTSPERIEIVFELQGDALVATKYDQSLYGTDGLRLKRQRNVRSKP